MLLINAKRRQYNNLSNDKLQIEILIAKTFCNEIQDLNIRQHIILQSI